MHSRFLERGLDVAEHVLHLEHLRMAPVQPAEKIFAGSTRTNADLPHRRFEGLVVAQTASTERLLDRVMEVVVLELRDPSGAVAPDARQPQDLSFADSRTEEHRDAVRTRRSSSRTSSSGEGRGSPNAT